MGVDLAIGPSITFIVAHPRKPARVLRRDITVIAICQCCALICGTTSLWLGRPLYYAFSENVLQLVQAHDISSGELYLGRAKNPNLAPHWYSLPRWIWAPLPADQNESRKIVLAAIGGGDDVIQMPRYFKRWDQGQSALHRQLKKVNDVAYFSQPEKQSLLQRMQASGLATDLLNAMPLTGRQHPLLAVFDPGTLKIIAILAPDPRLYGQRFVIVRHPSKAPNLTSQSRTDHLSAPALAPSAPARSTSPPEFGAPH